MELNKIYCGDCVEVMKSIDDNSIDAIITDPPYGLEFMGKEWDKLRPKEGSESFKGDFKGERISGGDFGERIGIKFGAPKKNPRCRKCGKLKFDHEKGKCKCENPDWNTRQSEYAYLQQMWHEQWATEAYRILKPGGYLLSFGGTRTYHRMACAIEDAGFEIRDMIEWIYGSGFPKSLDISKAIDKMAGAEREVTGHYMPPLDSDYYKKGFKPTDDTSCKNPSSYNPVKNTPTFLDRTLTAPSTPSAIQWQGWGTALKPAHEPICMARKPLSEKTVAENVLKYGTGGINIDECRVEALPRNTHRDRGFNKQGSKINKTNIGYNEGKISFATNQGRFPANLIHDGSDVVMAEFEKYGVSKSCGGENNDKYKDTAIWGNAKANWQHFNDSGTPARFFYCAKASKSERDMGCEGLEENEVKRQGLCGEHKNPLHKNNHPTVKPIKLMEYLIKLVTTEKAIVLDPFAGSGSTLIACRNLGRNYIGIEKEADYVEIANKRIAEIKQQLTLI